MDDPVLTLYSRAHCHLCDEMLEALRKLQGLRRFRVELRDVDGDPALARRYGEDVPVLAHGDRELCRHRLDGEALAVYLAKLA
jgi:hypothetical protein